MQILGLEGMSDEEFADQIENGARFVVYQYCISVLILTFKQPTNIYFIRAGESAVAKGLGWTALSWVLGWWGFPFGVIFTIWVTVVNFGGGVDVTREILDQMRPLEREDDDYDDRPRRRRSRYDDER